MFDFDWLDLIRHLIRHHEYLKVNTLNMPIISQSVSLEDLDRRLGDIKTKE